MGWISQLTTKYDNSICFLKRLDKILASYDAAFIVTSTNKGNFLVPLCITINKCNRNMRRCSFVKDDHLSTWLGWANKKTRNSFYNLILNHLKLSIDVRL